MFLSVFVVNLQLIWMFPLQFLSFWHKRHHLDAVVHIFVRWKRNSLWCDLEPMPLLGDEVELEMHWYNATVSHSFNLNQPTRFSISSSLMKAQLYMQLLVWKGWTYCHVVIEQGLMDRQTMYRSWAHNCGGSKLKSRTLASGNMPNFSREKPDTVVSHKLNYYCFIHNMNWLFLPKIKLLHIFPSTYFP